MHDKSCCKSSAVTPLVWISFLFNSANSAKWRWCTTEARGVCQPTRAGEPGQRETLPPAERTWLDHCLWNGWLRKISPGCRSCQTSWAHWRWTSPDQHCLMLIISIHYFETVKYYRNKSESEVILNWSPVSLIFQFQIYFLASLSSPFLTVHVLLQIVFLEAFTGCPLARWKNQTCWWKSSHCVSVLNRA